MQEMNQEKNTVNGTYGYHGYERNQIEGGWEGPIRGEKLNTEYETYDDTLVRRIKQEVLAESKKTNERFTGQRLLLALFSIGAVVAMFGFVVFALAFGHLSSGASESLGGSMFFLLGTIVIINAYFHFSEAATKEQKKKDKREK